MHGNRAHQTAYLAILLLALAAGGCGVAAVPGPSNTPMPVASPAAASPASPSAPEPADTAAPGAWTRLGDLRVPLRSVVALELLDGRVIVLDQGPNAISDLEGPPHDPIPPELLDPTTGTWTPAAALNAPRSDFVAVRLRDGRVLVTGGNNGWWGAYSSTKLFEPTTRQWTATGLLNTARIGPMGALLADGRVLVAGGRYSEGFRSEEEFSNRQTFQERTLNSAEIFDPLAERWTQTSSLHHLESATSTAFLLPDGRVVALGAFCEVFDPRDGAWSDAPGCVEQPVNSATVALRDGSLLIIGGTIEWDGPALSRVVRLDLATGASTDVAPLPTPRLGAVAAQLADGRVLVAGGATGWLEAPSPAAFIYDPGPDRWTPAASMPFASRPAQALVLSDGRVLVIGGEIPSAPDEVDVPPIAVGWTAVFEPDSAFAR